jgi:hypothetical protein
MMNETIEQKEKLDCNFHIDDVKTVEFKKISPNSNEIFRNHETENNFSSNFFQLSQNDNCLSEIEENKNSISTNSTTITSNNLPMNNSLQFNLLFLPSPLTSDQFSNQINKFKPSSNKNQTKSKASFIGVIIPPNLTENVTKNILKISQNSENSQKNLFFDNKNKISNLNNNEHSNDIIDKEIIHTSKLTPTSASTSSGLNDNYLHSFFSSLSSSSSSFSSSYPSSSSSPSSHSSYSTSFPSIFQYSANVISSLK